MAQVTRIVSFLAVVCIVCTSILSPTRAGTMPSGSHSQEPLEDGRLSRAHFDDFLRALTQSNPESMLLPSSGEEMPNDVFPLDSEHMTSADDKSLANQKMAPLKKRFHQRFCGTALADVLEMMCGKSFLSLFGKRSAPSSAVGPKSAEESWPFVSGNKALQVLSNQHSFHRYTRGVHDECCVKACTFDELRGYCANSHSPAIDSRFFG